MCCDGEDAVLDRKRYDAVVRPYMQKSLKPFEPAPLGPAARERGRGPPNRGSDAKGPCAGMVRSAVPLPVPDEPARSGVKHAPMAPFRVGGRGVGFDDRGVVVTIVGWYVRLFRG